MKHISTILLLIFTFIYLYTPPLTILPVQIDVLIYLIFGFMALKKSCNPIYALRVVGIRPAFNVMIVLFIISVFWTIFAPPRNIGFMDLKPISIIRLMVEVLFFPFVLVYFCKKKGFCQKQMIYALIYLAILQAYISVLMIFSPTVKDFITTYIISFTGNSKLAADSLLNTRVFGIASEYLFAMPIFQSMMACVYVSVHKKKSFFFYINMFCLICSAIFCARTSIFVFVGYLIYYNAKNIKTHFFSTFFYVTVIAIASWYAFHYLLSVDNILAIKHFNKAFTGEYDLSTFVDHHLFFPDDIVTWIMGDGTYKLFARRNSDLGYVNDIFYGGLVFLLLEMSSLYILYKRSLKANVLTNVLPFMFLILLVLHYKGNTYSANNFMKGIFLLYYITFFVKDNYIIAKRS